MLMEETEEAHQLVDTLLQKQKDALAPKSEQTARFSKGKDQARRSDADDMIHTIREEDEVESQIDTSMKKVSTVAEVGDKIEDG